MSMRQQRRAWVAAFGSVLGLCVAWGSTTAAAVPAQSPSEQGAIVGRVVNQVTGRAVAGASLVVEETGAQATSDDAGRFVVADLSVGTYRLLVAHKGYGPVRKTDVVVNANHDTSVDVELFELPEVKENVEVAASTFERTPEVANSVYGMSYEEIRRAPGALGDVGRMIQSLPGVASHADERNDIVARGGSPIENLTTVDGVEIPNVNHFASQGASGGAVSMLSAETVSGATFIAGGLPSQHGNRLSSALEVTLREGNRRRFQAEADVSMGGAGLVLEGPLGKHGSWLASGRRSYLDLAAGAFGESAVPVYSNYLVKAVWELGTLGRLSLVSLGGMDSFNQLNEKLSVTDTETHASNNRAWRAVTGLTMQAFLGTKGALNLTAAYAPTGTRAEEKDRTLNQITMRNRSTEGEATLKSDLTYQLRSRMVLRAGAAVRRFTSHYRFEQPFGVQNDFSTDAARIDAFSTDVRDHTDHEGGYAQMTVTPHARFDVTLGGRVDRYGFSKRWTATPRGSLVLHVARGLDLSTTFGSYRQMPPFALMVGIPENRALSVMRADHAVVGLSYLPRPDLKVAIETYDKRYRDYPVSIENPFLSLASMAAYYDINDILTPMVSRGRGRSRGIELSLQKKLTRAFYGQVSYAYSRSENQALDGVWRRSGFDLPHILSVVGGARLSERWELSTKFSYSSGRPVTPLLERESEEQNRTVFDASRILTARTPAYHRLDVRVDRRFHRRWGTITLYIEGDNVYNRKNVLRYVWNANARKYATESQLSLLVLGGVTARF